ncbi:MAG: DNA translocase FtsK 4TM domain-containing protein [Anaerolineaceae bacterium]
MAKPVSRRPKSSAKSPVKKPAPSRRVSAPLRQARRPARKSNFPRLKMGSVSPERKLDVAGILLAFIGLISLLSLISNQRGSLTGWWVAALYRTAGWGAFILPLVLIGLGLWLIFRNIERLPLLSTERLVGLALLLFNLLSWLHLIAGGGWEIVLQNKGGGIIGALFERLLVTSIGTVGAVVALSAWSLIGLALSFDLSIPDIVHYADLLAARMRQALNQARSAQPGYRRPAEKASPPAGAPVVELPNGFQPLSQHTNLTVLPRRPAVAPKNGPKEVDAPPLPPAPGEPVFQPPPPIRVAPPAWTLPSIEQILDPSTPETIHAYQDQDRGRIIETTLASFSVPAHVIEIHHGPTITQFGVEPDFVETRNGRMRVRVSKIVALQNDLALALAAPRIRIQAPVPGRNYVGIEVPNAEISKVTLREVLESDAFQDAHWALRIGLGKDVAGKVIPVDLAGLPHLLIAGTTGAGKSVCVNAILASLLMNNSPEDLRLVLVDPKRVELVGYNGIPHLLAPVVADPDRVVSALQWMMREMDNRYHKFAQAGVRNIIEFNTRMPEEHLPYLVVVVDELADLMLQAPDETERTITRLAQLARATGIHLILATQRPSVNVVTGLIKANFPARIAFMVAAMVDSRVILDQPGAERLLGRGDMLYQAPDAPGPVRVQGAFVSDSETQHLVEYWRQEAINKGGTPPAPGGGSVDALPSGVPFKQAGLWDEEGGPGEGDPLIGDAIDLVRREGRASITMLQRRMRVGYTRAARLIDVMEEKGIIGPPVSNSQVRAVLDYGPTIPPKEE